MKNEKLKIKGDTLTGTGKLIAISSWLQIEMMKKRDGGRRTRDERMRDEGRGERESY